MSCKRIRLVVKDSADESSYVPVLEAAGYVLQIRKPNWFEYCLFKGPDTDVNLYVFSLGTSEIDRMLHFRDWLRTNDTDRDKYAQVKRSLAKNKWRHVQHYANAKTSIVQEIMKTLIVKVVVSKNIYFLFFQVIRYCSVPDVSINKLSTVIGNHVRHRIRPDYHHFE